MNLYQQVMREIIWEKRGSPTNYHFASPQWFNGTAVSIPHVEVGRKVGHMARALVAEQVAGEQFRAKRAFEGAA